MNSSSLPFRKRKRNNASSYKNKKFPRLSTPLYKSPSLRTSPLPLSLRTKLRYNWNGAMSSAIAGFVCTQIFQCNGLYDPDYSGVGNQPRGFDQLMTMYSHYCVTKAKITVTFSTTGTGSYSTTSMVGIAIKRDTAASTLAQDYMESPLYTYATLPAKPATFPGADRRLTYSIDLAKYFGRKNIVNAVDLTGTISANPTEQAAFHLFAYPGNTTLVQGTIQMSVVIDYYVTLTEPADPTQS